MTCAQAMERMLSADPAELGREGDSPLARHLAHCERCAAVAVTLTRELRALDSVLEEYAGAADPALEARRALARSRGGTQGALGTEAASPGATVEESAPVVDLGQRRERHGRRGRGWRAGLGGLAAAAAVSAILWLDWPASPDPAGVPVTPTADAGRGAIRPRVAVQPPGDQTAVVMATEDPNITIVWLYPREES